MTLGGGAGIGNGVAAAEGDGGLETKLLRGTVVVVALAAGAASPPLAAEPLAGFGLANIAISTPNHERMIGWYTDVLGFKLVERAEGLGGIRLALVERDGVRIDLINATGMEPLAAPKDPPRHLERPGIANLVFWVDDLRATDAHLKSKGVALLFESLFVGGIGTTISAFRDPDGNLLALWQRRP